MRHAPSGYTDGVTAPGRPGGNRTDDLAEKAAALLTGPGLVVFTGGPGCGRSTILRQLGEGFHGPVFAGGGLAMLQSVPAFALARAVRVRLPTHDPALLAEAVRSRVRGGLLLVDDLHWADPLTLTALIPLAAHCRVAAALRTPHRLPADAVAALAHAAAGWLAVPPLDPVAATALAHDLAPNLTPSAIADVVHRGGGAPLAVATLARHAATAATIGPAPDDVDQVTHAVATALADLTRPARTAMAALGLLGRPATAAVLGTGVAELTAAGLVTTDPDTLISPVSPYVADVAAGLLDGDARRALHRKLAELIPAREAARHLAAAGDDAAAYRRALAAATEAATTGERAELLLLACDLPGVDPPPSTRLAAATAALACGRPRTAIRVLPTTADAGTDAAVLRAEALLQLGDLTAARAAAAAIPDQATIDQRAARDRILLLAQLAHEPIPATLTAAELTTRYGPEPAHTGLRAALAATAATTRDPGWEYALASAAAAAGTAGDTLTAHWSAWLLVEALAADGRLDEAARTAGAAAAACAADLAYSWQTRFLAAQLWCTALRGGADCDDTLRHAGDLIDRTLPAQARGYAVAAASLIEADGGLLGTARARLANTTTGWTTVDTVLDWVDREAAWLDGQPGRALAAAPTGGPPLVDGLRRITARWAAYDRGVDHTTEDDEAQLPPIRQTLNAWSAAGGRPAAFAAAATAWHQLALREHVRCLLAQGLHEPDAERAVEPLLAAERLAADAGLVVLLGRARRALRHHSVRRDGRSARAHADDELTGRERDVLRLVAAGEPTRRIAGQLGISSETVETHIRAGMRKLGARTRTEAAALALPVLV